MMAAVSTTPNPKVSTYSNPKRSPLLPSEAQNAPRRPESREVTSRYMSSNSSSSTTSSSVTSNSYSSSSNSSYSRRCPSPLVSRPVPVTPMPNLSKRSQSVERKRAVTPRPITPEMSNAAKLLVTSRRSLSVSFQGESFSLPINKAKPTVNSISSMRKATPERRKAAPVIDHTENARPSDQHRWPGRSRQVNLNVTTRSMDFADERAKLRGSGSARALQKSMMDESTRVTIDAKLRQERHNAELEKTVQPVAEPNLPTGSTEISDPAASDSESVSSGSNSGVQECGDVAQVKGGPRGIVVPARFWQETNVRLRRAPELGSPVSKDNRLKPTVSAKSIGTKQLLTDTLISSPRGILKSRGLSFPLGVGARPASPSKTLTSSTSSPSRGIPSPTRTRNWSASSSNTNVMSTPSILGFAADVRTGKLGENRVVGAHELRLLYNRYLQWRFVNARADAALFLQKVTTEKSLYTAWVTTLKLRHSIKSKRIKLQLLRKNLKLHCILKEQMLYLDSWDLIGWEHSSSLSGAIEALEACTLRLPVVGGARADIQNVKKAICSAVDVIQAMAYSLHSLLTKVEPVNSLVSELANVIANERGLLDQGKNLLSTLKSMQVQDCSLRTHILQLRRLSSSMTTEV
ncbi:unnamed protein product [Ilex paraguariensis]|uniref:QWRF motif-containing protein 2 n=1 Tax=Ilex paraguariensis TaxID=185542 RepID=A0ABC8UE12_9AQUA